MNLPTAERIRMVVLDLVSQRPVEPSELVERVLGPRTDDVAFASAVRSTIEQCLLSGCIRPILERTTLSPPIRVFELTASGAHELRRLHQLVLTSVSAQRAAA
ncbi:MAG: hypothetical protein IT436_18830 [Phycisphaerales bacterium]|nr:hypothetical protein [Phycisphaerales bacterium]